MDDDKGQMILLAALVACLCLLGVAACVAALDSGSYGERSHFSWGELTNVCWSQEGALRRAALHYSVVPWDDRASAVAGFKAEANTSVANLSLMLLKQRAVYRFAFNDSLGAEYAAHDPEKVNLGGVLLERNGSVANVRGCAYDMEIFSDRVSYRLSHVIAFD